jgi:hypothetical protein
MDTWDLIINWNLVIPPSRPSKWQLDWISLYVNNLDLSHPVAILGSTPEFRDHLYELGFKNIYVFDKNPVFYQKMSAIRIYRNEEIFVQGDWLDTLDRYPNRFTIILSDLTSGNIAYDKRAKFYWLIAKALTKPGIFCDKELTHPGINYSVLELVDKYMHLPLNLMHVNYFSCEMLFCSTLLDAELCVDSTKFYQTLHNDVRHPRVQGFIQQARLITPTGCFWYYGKKWHELEKDYCDTLKRVDEKNDEPNSPYFGRVKFFVHKKV